MGAVREYAFDVGIETSSLPAAGSPVNDSDMMTKGYADLHYAGGIVPHGAIIAIASNLTGAMAMPASGTVNGDGYQYCDGAAIPAGKVVSGNTPNLTDSRFLMGSTSSGTTGGTSSQSITIGSANLPPHQHTTGSHTHDVNPAAFTSGGGAHTHVQGSGTITASGGAGFGDVDYAGTGGYDWGYTVVGSTAEDSPAHTHSIDVPNTTTNSQSASNTGDGGFANTAITIVPLYLKVQYVMRVK